MIKSRLAAALVMTTIAWLAFASAASAETPISPTATSGSHSCFPPIGDPYGHRCVTSHYGFPWRLAVDLFVGSASGGSAPTAYDVEGLATMSSTATHQLSAPAPQVVYTWKYVVDDAGTTEPTRIHFDQEPQGTPPVNYVALQVSADHATCATCTAVNRAVLIGEDPDTGQSGPSQLADGTVVQVTTTLTNTAGGDIPAGDITLQADLQGRSDWTAAPTFQGLAHVESALLHHSLVAAGDGSQPDADLDSVPDSTDNCPNTSNLDQTNTDGDTEGNACDSDDDNDTVPDGADACPVETGGSPNGCPQRTLAISVQGSGTGTVIGDGINCPGDCTQTYFDGQQIALSATGTGGSSFVGWSGDCSGTGSCQLTMDSDRTATASFVPPAPPVVMVSGADTTSDLEGSHLTCGTGANPCDTIQHGIDRANAGGTVQVAAGTYREQVEIGKQLTLDGAGASTVVESPDVGALADKFDATLDRRPVVLAHDAGSVTIQELLVDGRRQGSPSCDFAFFGIAYHNAGGRVTDTTVTSTRSEPRGDCFASGIYNLNDSNTERTWAADSNTVLDYGDTGIGAGNRASVVGGLTDVTISNNTVTGGGNISEGFQDGIGIGNFIEATVTGNTVRDNRCDHPDCGPDPIADLQSSGVSLANVADGTQVAGNDLAGNDLGVYSWLPDSGSVSIEDNTLTDNRYVGLVLDEGNHVITDNRFSGGATGVAVVGFEDSVRSSIGTLTGNTITGTDTGIEVMDENDADSTISYLTARFNRIVGNGIGVLNTTSELVPVRDDWWGCNAGPGQPGCDSVEGNVAAYPWLLLRATAAPTSIPTGGATSTITASLRRNSYGAEPTDNAFPDGVPIAFATDLGNISPPQDDTAGPEALTTLTSGVSAGVAHVSATLDGQTVTTNVTFSGTPPPDADHDGVPDATDNCPATSNPDQANRDNDAQGNACDADDDNDSVADGADGCPVGETGWTSTTQADRDADGCRDATEDTDDDNDTVADGGDNCPTTSNQAQTNSDTDSLGDACDPDDDNDTVVDASDNCDLEPGPSSNAGCPETQPQDQDGDGRSDSSDNCPAVANPNQANRDGDAQGDACDPDDDNDSVGDGADGCPSGETGWTSTTAADADADGCRDASEDADDDNDTVTDSGDNCRTAANQAQTNSDTDSLGDACDPDDDNDGFADASDACPIVVGAAPSGCPSPPPPITPTQTLAPTPPSATSPSPTSKPAKKCKKKAGKKCKKKK